MAEQPNNVIAFPVDRITQEDTRFAHGDAPLLSIDTARAVVIAVDREPGDIRRHRITQAQLVGPALNAFREHEVNAARKAA